MLLGVTGIMSLAVIGHRLKDYQTRYLQTLGDKDLSCYASHMCWENGLSKTSQLTFL